MESRDELRYQMLRSLCDKANYLEPFDYGSIELVEKLINDIIALKRKFKKCEKNINELNNRNDYLILGINAYKIQNVELFKENNELHNEILNLNNKLNFKGKDFEFCKLKDDKTSLHFLLTEANKKIEILYHQLNESKKKYIELIENLYKRNIESPKMLDVLTKDFKVKLDPKIYDFDKYESDIENNKKVSNSATDYNLYNNIAITTDNKNYTYLEEKCKNLEKELDNKNKEIELLKTNVYGNNKEEQRIVIDYLENKIRDERIKYENYLTFTLNENKKLEKKQQKIENEKIERRKKYGIEAALKNFGINTKINKSRKTFSENNNKKSKNKIKNFNHLETARNKNHNNIIFENNFLI
jgi:centrosomal protein CEP135